MSGRSQIQFSFIALIGVLFLCLSAHYKLHVPGLAVPFTLQTLVLLLIGYYLNIWWAIATICLYLVVGILGFPAFASAPNSADMFMSSSVGYLLGFILAVVCIAMYKRPVKGNGLINLILFIVAHFIILVAGMIGLILVKGLPVDTAFYNGVSPFIIGALIKSILAFGIIVIVEKVLKNTQIRFN